MGKCFYCGKGAVGMKATSYFNTSPTCFRYLCKKHWEKVWTEYNGEDDSYYDNK